MLKLNHLIKTLTIFPLLIAIGVLTGWYLDLPILVQLNEHWAPMQFNTGVCFALLSVALLMTLAKNEFYFVPMSLAGIILGLTMMEYLFTLNLKIDDLFIEPYIVTETKYPGRMAPNTAFCFSLLIISLVLLNFKTNACKLIGGFIGLLLFGISLTTLTGYFLEIETVYNWGKVTAMAAHTSTCFIFIGAAITILSKKRISRAYFEQAKTTYIFFLGLTIQIIIFLIDSVIPAGVAAAMGHVLILIIVSLTEKKQHLTIILISSIFFVWLGYAISPPGSTEWIVLANRFLTSFACLIVYILLLTILVKSENLKNQKKNLDKIVEERTVELKKRNAELEQFAYISTHDLQEPLRTINSYSELLSETNKDKVDDLGKRSIEYILAASFRAQNLIKGLLDYSRLGGSVQMSEVSVRLLCNTVKEDLKALIDEKDAQVIVGSLPRILCYEKELRLLFQNLIINAIKYHKPEEKPIVRIDYTEETNSHLFSVIDNGIGIDNVFSERIFHLFQRLHNQSEYEGTGIGLSQCKKIANLHNGEIWVESEKFVGSIFYLRIPKNLIKR